MTSYCCKRHSQYAGYTHEGISTLWPCRQILFYTQITILLYATASSRISTLQDPIPVIRTST